MLITKTKVPIKIWTDVVEDSCLTQAVNIADNMPVHDHLALMPDCHSGYGMPIGGVLPLINGISPHCVGVDIGCGMSCIRTNLHREDVPLELQGKIFSEIRATIPVGFNHNKEKQSWGGFDRVPKIDIIQDQLDSAKYQLGSLGGGNHFLSEFQKDKDNNVYVMLHSGSRNLGLKIAEHYHKLAVEHGIVPRIKDLAYFSSGTPLFDEYLEAMNYALEFAYANRHLMMEKTISIIQKYIPKMQVIDFYNIHHNYAVEDRSLGKGIYLHRKGATNASSDTIGLIPGSMGSNSYIVRGMGNPESFNSCSHGSGRRMSRGEAKKKISKEEYWKSLEDAGLEVNRNDSRVYIDEAPGAYKDIHEVMENQKDLVEIVVELTPFGYPAIKG